MDSSITGGSVVWNFEVNKTGLEAGLATAKGEIEATAASAEASMSASMASVGTSLYTTGRELSRAVTLPVVALGVAVFKTSSDFETALTKIVGLVGISRDQVNAWAGDFEKLAVATGKAPTELANAMFFITSAGLRGQTALDALTVSAKASAAGLGDTAVIADAVTSALNSYASTNLKASTATDILVAAVKEGKVGADELAGTLGPLLPTASALGISFQDVAGVIANLTRVGYGAANAATSVNAVMSSLLKPSSQAVDVLGSVGIKFSDLRDMLAKPQGLITVMRLLDDKFQGNDASLAQVIPNVRALRGVMAILAQSGTQVDSVMQGVANSTGATDAAFAAVNKDSGFKFNQVMSQIKVALINIGNTAAPAIAGVLQKLGDIITVLADKWSKLPKGVQDSIITFLGLLAALGPVLLTVGALIRLTGKFGEALTAIQKHPVIYAIALLITTLVYLQARFQIFTKAWEWLNKVWDDTVKIWQNNIMPILGNIKQWFVDAKKFIGDVVTGVLKDLGQWFKNAKQWINDITKAYDDNTGNLKVIADVITVLVLPALVRLGTMALISAAQVAAAGVIAAAGWIASTAADLWGWATSLPGLVLTAAKNAVKVAAQGVIAAAGWIADGVSTIWGWATSLASLLLNATKQALKIAAQGIIAAAGWIATGWGWVGTLAGIVIKATMSAAVIAAEGLVAAGGWIIAAGAMALAWLIAAGPIIIIIGAILLVVALAVALIIKYWKDIKKWAVEAWQAVYDAVKAVADWIVNFFSGAVTWLSKAGSDIVHGLADGVSGAAKFVWDGIKFVADKIGAFFTGAWNWLFDVGKSIIQGLVDGIKSMAEAPYNAAKDILKKVKNLLPFSPAKEGPFSGKGWTLFSGAALVKGFADGIKKESANAIVTMNDMLGSMQANISVNPSVSDMAINHGSGSKTNNSVTVNMSGIMARSRSDLRSIAKDMIKSVNEEITAKGATPIGGGAV